MSQRFQCVSAKPRPRPRLVADAPVQPGAQFRDIGEQPVGIDLGHPGEIDRARCIRSARTLWRVPLAQTRPIAAPAAHRCASRQCRRRARTPGCSHWRSSGGQFFGRRRGAVRTHSLRIPGARRTRGSFRWASGDSSAAFSPPFGHLVRFRAAIAIVFRLWRTAVCYTCISENKSVPQEPVLCTPTASPSAGAWSDRRHGHDPRPNSGCSSRCRRTSPMRWPPKSNWRC